MRKELMIGLLLFAVALLLQCLHATPHVLMGLLLGLAICLELIGALPERAYQRLKAGKRALFRQK